LNLIDNAEGEITNLFAKNLFMKHTTPKKSIADFTKNAIVSTDHLLKIKGGTTEVLEIIIEEPNL